MSRVFIPQEPRTRDKTTNDWRPLYDLTPALKFGTLQVLLPHGPMLLATEPMIADLKERLKDYTADDYIMCIGDPSAIAAAVLVAGQINGGKVSLLKYDRNEKQYNPIMYQV
jgi:hypothetical protein